MFLGVIADDHFAGLRIGQKQLQGVHEDPFLECFVVRAAQRVAGDVTARAKGARWARLRAFLRLDRDDGPDDDRE